MAREAAAGGSLSSSGDSTCSGWRVYTVRARDLPELLAAVGSDGTSDCFRLPIRIIHNASRQLELHSSRQASI